MLLTLFIFGAVIAAVGVWNMLFTSSTAYHELAYTLASLGGCAIMAAAILLPKVIA